MPKFISRYPDGVTGIALLLMRTSSALIAFPALGRFSPAVAGWWAPTAGALLLALMLLTGFGTRASALLLLLVLAGDLPAARGEVLLFILGAVGGAGALALLGPGAYSIDAHRFGRRVIRLEPRSPDRGGPG